jgi:urease accessory protein UreF
MQGDAASLAAQVGTPDFLGLIHPAAAAQVQSSVSLQGFVDHYLSTVLAREEWPLICQAYELASRGQVRELIELDATWTTHFAKRPGANASVRVGQRQLGKLRPLRDNRMVQRYLAAIESGNAVGWHTIVYAITLAVFQLPLRQGLIHYAVQTLTGFVNPLPATPLLTEGQKESILAQAENSLPAVLRLILPAGDPPAICAV